MSLKLAALCWELQLTHAEFKVLSALADCAEDDGSHCYPGIPYLVWKTDYDERTVRRTLRQLEEKTYIEVVHPATGGAGEFTHYQLHMDRVPRKSPYRRRNGGKTPPYRARTGASVRTNGGTGASERGQEIPVTGADDPENGGILSSETVAIADADTGNPIRSVVDPSSDPVSDPIVDPTRVRARMVHQVLKPKDREAAERAALLAEADLAEAARREERAALLARLETDEAAQQRWLRVWSLRPVLPPIFRAAFLRLPQGAGEPIAVFWRTDAELKRALEFGDFARQVRDRLAVEFGNRLGQSPPVKFLSAESVLAVLEQQERAAG